VSTACSLLAVLRQGVRGLWCCVWAPESWSVTKLTLVHRALARPGFVCAGSSARMTASASMM
jgi:hypothetical protein